MAKTASLNATNRPGVRCVEGESCPALPPGARAVASERTQWITEATQALLVGDGITGTVSTRVGAPDRGARLAGPGARLHAWLRRYRGARSGLVRRSHK